MSFLVFLFNVPPTLWLRQAVVRGQSSQPQASRRGSTIHTIQYKNDIYDIKYGVLQVTPEMGCFSSMQPMTEIRNGGIRECQIDAKRRIGARTARE
ncbi:hypothetical protein BDW42DRAFT_76509 [Aspergillus taichungensis]|uniref:Uncharacterized protein n=1 Tax=Aspergillus taichungensis TaxID=482145 RepID=A0A2J5I904_9EURO|nr:hypothetical protein BDW42DRAFT_76509 [Aspergillus taichungensis]